MESSGPQKRLSHERISACELDMSSVWIFESLWYETEDGRERVTESIFHGSAKCITYLGVIDVEAPGGVTPKLVTAWR